MRITLFVPLDILIENLVSYTTSLIKINGSTNLEPFSKYSNITFHHLENKKEATIMNALPCILLHYYFNIVKIHKRYPHIQNKRSSVIINPLLIK